MDTDFASTHFRESSMLQRASHVENSACKADFARIVRISTSHQCSRGPTSSAHQRFKAARRTVCILREQGKQVNLEMKKAYRISHAFPCTQSRAGDGSQFPKYSAVDFMKSCGARPVVSIPRFCWGSKCSCFPTTLYFDVQPTEVENALLCWHPPSCDPSGGALL